MERRTSFPESPVQVGELRRSADVVPFPRVVFAGDAAFLDETVGPRKELEPGAGRDAREHAGMEHGDVAIREARPIAHDDVARKGHVTRGMPRRIVDQYEVRGAWHRVGRNAR